MRLIQKSLITLIAYIPVLALAHPGHDHHTGFWAGFIHPFTGLDHLMMAIAFGVLMWTANQRWKLFGLIGLAIAMVAGFMIGSQDLIPSSVAEYGIIASLVLLAIALWTKSNQSLPIVAVLLASFHGVAHGTEFGQSGHASLLVLGMVTAMALIYAGGLGIGALIKKYVPYGKQIIGTLAALVAVIGLA
ncbi:HupE/UreJ family protein [Acinetobacter bereziniae]|uniref:HupE/UreJ family protein n=1 Tax=Acinetobacter bereziniae TaxID=106648 RepID=UPI003008D30A